MRERFATPSGGRFPQARMVALVACGIRWIIAARIDSSGVSEQVLADRAGGVAVGDGVVPARVQTGAPATGSEAASEAGSEAGAKAGVARPAGAGAAVGSVFAPATGRR
jgi:hypothetical protein